MKELIKDMALKSWKDTREKLMEYLWIGALHDDEGKKAFGDVTANLSQESQD
jgi:hypothetical protein